MKAILFAAGFIAALSLAAVADVHQWQLPAGFYNAGVRVAGFDQSGNETANTLSLTAGSGLHVPISIPVPGTSPSNQQAITPTHCTLTDAGVAGTPKCVATTGRAYVDGGPVICFAQDPVTSGALVTTFSYPTTTVAGAAGQYGDAVNILCIGP